MAKFCSNCGKQLDDSAKACPACGKSFVAEANRPQQSPVIVNVENKNTNVVNGGGAGNAKSKWVALFLCFFFGYLGAHRFYEGKIGTGILWLFTGGLCGVGWFIDFFILLFKRNPYYV